ncbi:putative vacuolar protein sorting-associated protein 16 -like protein [Ceratocystis fimbriata CBS 114723]|uniref:Probable vacuolar protein sorting-associated protein 16 homolog n=1 Tax=Ceratocystis fimbriata CBS 114723 TaxID=1035309 RepID=A0A2C5WTP9_9PEZI|nr:putative vacuolar protein sorting-associated protein 16 -like protein [Ceratocystis fimbriata CBS 114723]
MDAAQPRTNWERLGDKWYRKIQLYTEVFDQDLNLDNYVIAAASYGGSLALWKDDTKLIAYQAGKSSKHSIDIYSYAGKPLRQIPWDNGTIKGLGWSEDELLLVVMPEGTVRCYDYQGEFTQFTLGHGAENYGVVSCKFYGQGLVALLGNNTLISVASYSEPRPKPLAPVPNGTVHAWAIVPPNHTLSRSVEALVSLENTIYCVDATDCEDRFLDIGPFSHISVSPNGRRVALYTVGGIAHVVSSDFQERFVEHNANSEIPPKHVEWAGSDAVIAWEDEVHIIGPDDTSVTYLYDTNRVHVISEHDGAIVLTNDVCEFIQEVPPETNQVFGQFAESTPASILLDAVAQLELQSPKADDYIQLIRGSLTEAVNTCVNAAGCEFDIHWQKQLLKAASFGKSVLDLYNSDDFVDMCETLRVLNAVRFFEIGMPLSIEQFHRLTAERLVERLLCRNEYLLALKVAQYLRIPTDGIYVHWATAKVKVGKEDDETVCRLIVEKLQGRPGVSFEEIARAAYGEGRGRLATQLLNHEPRGGRQVPLLLAMEEDELALDKAIESGDTDLMLFVLLQLKAKLPLAAFFRLLNTRPTASALIETLAIREGDNSLLKDLYYQDDRRMDGAIVFLRESLDQPTSRIAADKIALAAKILAESKESNFELHSLKESTMLLRTQEALDRDLTDEFTGLSVNETMFQLIKLGNFGKAKKLQSEFKIPEKVAWWIRLRALIAKRDWAEITEISKQRKSPIGWEPFYNLSLQAGNPRVAAMFIPKCTTLGPGMTISMYEKCGLKVKAAEEAVRLRDADAYVRILQAAGRGTEEGREIERLGATVFKR